MPSRTRIETLHTMIRMLSVAERKMNLFLLVRGRRALVTATADHIKAMNGRMTLILMQDSTKTIATTTLPLSREQTLALPSKRRGIRSERGIQSKESHRKLLSLLLCELDIWE